jgi:hypothetical protein
LIGARAEVRPDYDAVGSYRRPLSFDAGAAGAPQRMITPP